MHASGKLAQRGGINPALRRSYDLRGMVGRDLLPKDARAVGVAFAALARAHGQLRTVLSRDGRLSSPALEAALAEGLCAGGMQVLRLPLGPTPLVSFAMDRLSVSCGVMVTGSHNPADQNGFKLLLDGRPLHGTRLGALWTAARDEPGGGALSEVDLSDDYLAALASELHGTAPMRIAWDSGNGATGSIVERLTRRIPGRHFKVHTRIDGRFPNHHPDPSVPENLQDLSGTVVREGCDLGIAFDGDGDRLGAVDGTGCIVWPDQLLLLLAGDLLGERPGSTVIGDVKSSGVLFDGIAAAGGRPLMGPSGYVKVRELMVRENAPLAGEMSGHIFFGDRWHGSDDGLYVAMRLVRALSRSGRTLRAFREGLPATAATPEVRITCPDTMKAPVMARIAARLQANGALVDRTDGLRVSRKDGWWLVRVSGTEPKLTVRCEANDRKGLERLKSEATAHLRSAGLDTADLEPRPAPASAGG